MEIDCPQIVGLLEGSDLIDARFLKGFVTIESETDLQVVGVYTSSTIPDVQDCAADYISLNTGFDQDGNTLIADLQLDDD
jgi:hypothetical protein